MVELDDIDRMSDAHDTFKDHPPDLAYPSGLQGVNGIANDGKTMASPIRDTSREGSIPVNTDRASDAGSVHSMPAVHIPEPHLRRPASGTFVESPTAITPFASSSSQAEAPAVQSSLTAQDRRNRHRSAIEVRSSSRLSGFLNNLIHRRDTGQPAHSRSMFREERVQSSANPPSSTVPRSSSPIPRASTPPPRLPPPTLQELGLSFSVLTSDLSPSHFSAPPWSGTFLRPHYLLLCHAQGLDVLPLVSPPAPQPYTLVRRVPFKSVVVMEHRGILVAIAGRRDGVRVYALEEVKKVIEWRIEFEGRRERERMRKEAAKKISSSGVDSGGELCHSLDKNHRPTPSITSFTAAKNVARRSSHAPSATTPKAPTAKTIKPSTPPVVPDTFGQPPPYTDLSDIPSPEGPSLKNPSQPRRPSVSNVLAKPSGSRRHRETDILIPHNRDSKPEREEGSSDDEAIDIVAAGASGSQALDERTSAIHSSPQSNPALAISESRPAIRHSQASSPLPRNRSATINRSRSGTSATIPPSPTPTLLTLRQALSQSSGQMSEQEHDPGIPMENVEVGDEGCRITLAQALLESRLPDLPPLGTRRPQQPILIMSTIAADPIVSSTPRTSDDEDDQEEGGISLAQALMESRLPHLPPAGTRRPQQPILITDAIVSVQRASDAIPTKNCPNGGERSERRRRRWSVLDGMFSSTSAHQSSDPSPPSQPLAAAFTPDAPTDAALRERPEPSLSRSLSNRSQSIRAPGSSTQVSASGERSVTSATRTPSPHPDLVLPSSRSGLIPRIISKAFHPRRSDDHFQGLVFKTADDDSAKHGTHPAPQPKLDYMKLPGTKGALLIRAVETPKKSFLAILCGDNGQKVELFAGTYRTALGLSRTFILPDSPKSMELQLQGDDLVEIFLVFSQNVFGLEPATVRVREVRIGRAERRAARRRARQIRTEELVNEAEEFQLGDEDPNVNFNVDVTVLMAPNAGPTNDGDQTSFLPSPDPEEATPQRGESSNTPTPAHVEELVALASAQMGPYTTFQQLSFAPKFPLASIAEGCIIPPTYPDFLKYRVEYEPQIPSGRTGSDAIPTSPPGVSVPATRPASKWLYRDPKGVVHGPWKASLMQSWLKEDLLPPDLPVKREGEAEFILLKELRLQCADPTHPFRPPPPAPAPAPNSEPLDIMHNPAKYLLPPISLLSQPKHFGPPALFFSSRGGHSTTIVDSRGRSVLKGRFMWSNEPEDDPTLTLGRMGDVKRLEAFDVKDRAVLVAMRQGGLEAVDFGDALLRPADESRTVLPQFSPPPSNISRRGPFVWKMGTPVFSSPTSSTVLSSKPKGKKQSTGSGRSPMGKTEFSFDGEDGHEEVLYLGRKDDEVYICERNAGTFRILRLCPSRHA